VTQHDGRFVLLSAEEFIVFCVEGVEEVFDVVQRVGLYAERLQSYIVLELDSVLLFVLVSHFFEFLLSEV
jgi:hypothetical protein